MSADPDSAFVFGYAPPVAPATESTGSAPAPVSSATASNTEYDLSVIVSESEFENVDRQYQLYRQLLSEWSMLKYDSAIGSFSSKLAASGTVTAELVASFHGFVESTGKSLRAEPLFHWTEPEGSRLELVLSLQAMLERDIATRKYAALLDAAARAPHEPAGADGAPNHARKAHDAATDDFGARVGALSQVLLARHLDLHFAPASDALLDQAMEQLRRLEWHQAPREKVVRILNACHFIFATMHGSISADDFLPCLIYVAVKAACADLPRHVAFAHQFLAPEARSSEAGYYVVQLTSVVSFVQTLEPSSLTFAAGELDSGSEWHAYFASYRPIAAAAVLPWLANASHAVGDEAVAEAALAAIPGLALPGNASAAPNPAAPSNAADSAARLSSGISGATALPDAGALSVISRAVHERALADQASASANELARLRMAHEAALARQADRHEVATRALQIKCEHLRTAMAQLKQQLSGGDHATIVKQNIAYRDSLVEAEDELKRMKAARDIDADLMAELRERCQFFGRQVGALETQADLYRSKIDALSEQVRSESAELADARAASAGAEARLARVLETERLEHARLAVELERTKAALAETTIESHRWQAEAAKSAAALAGLEATAQRFPVLERAAAEATRQAETAARERDDALDELARTSRSLQAIQDTFEHSRAAHAKQLAGLELAYAALQREVALLRDGGPVPTGDGAGLGGAGAGHAGTSVSAAPGEAGAASGGGGHDVARENATLHSELETLRTRMQCDLDALEAREQALRAALGASEERSDSLASALKKERTLTTMLQGEIKNVLADREERTANLTKKLKNANETAMQAMRIKAEAEELLELERTKTAELSASVSVLVNEVSQLEMAIQEKEYSELNRETWVPDEDMKVCNRCEREFTLLRRKHHCRLCGHIYCHDCSSNRVAIPSSPTPVRCCDVCFASKTKPRRRMGSTASFGSAPISLTH